VVTHDIPDGAIAVGVPAQVIKHRSSLESNPAKQPKGASQI
jgi:acetyltransferase-like isoleucine patch superfamily enzyme